MIHVISLGAGVQSSTMALMAAHGEIEPMPKFAIFADTGWEPRAVYEWLDWLTPELERHFPVIRVSKGNIRDEQVNARVRGRAIDGHRWASLPYFTKLARVDDGLPAKEQRKGRVKRQCTSEYKIEPIETYLRREVLGLAKGQHAPTEPVICQWRGISTDEAGRMKPSRVKWMTVRYPLAMEHRMSRSDCKMWMLRKGYPMPPRSACIGCPFHSNDEWRDMRDNRPDEWDDAVNFDEAIRVAGGVRGKTYLHRSCVPLAAVDLDTPEDKGQMGLWGEECEGMCGL